MITRTLFAAAALLAGSLLAGCQTTSPDSTSKATSSPAVYQVRDCPDKGSLPSANVECADLTVVQQRSGSSAATLSIPVIRLKGKAGLDNAVPPTPLIVLGGGGPGAPLGTDSNSIRGHRQVFTPLLETGRDVIVIEQRGVGASRPATYCRDSFDTIERLFRTDLKHATTLQIQVEATARCRTDLIDGGVVVGAYTNDETVNDVNDLRMALGIDRWIILGGSAAATIAIGMMERFPETVEAAILDSPSPPEHYFLRERHRIYNDAFRKLLNQCQQVAECHQSYPDLEVRLIRTLLQLQTKPIVLTVPHPLEQRDFHFHLNRDRLLDVLFLSLYWKDSIQSLPNIIYRLSQQDYDVVQPLIGSYLRLFSDDQWGDGLWMDIQCREKLPFLSDGSSPKPEDNSLLPGPFSPSVFKSSINDMQTLCETWHSGDPVVGASKPLVSAIPTLILSGELDPITPRRIAKAVGARLENSRHVVLNGHGHAVALSSDCAMTLMGQFLQTNFQSASDSCSSDSEAWQFKLPEP